MKLRRTLLGLVALVYLWAGPMAAQDAVGWTERLRAEARRSTVREALASAVRSLEEQGSPGDARRLAQVARAPGEAPLEALLGRVLEGERLERELRALRPIVFGVASPGAELLLREEIAAYRGTLCVEPSPGFDPAVEAIDPTAPHSMADVATYVTHHTGGHVQAATRWGWPVELHAGPLGLALRSLRQRGYGKPVLLTTPGLVAGKTDGFLAAFRPDGSPVLVYAGALGRDRYLHAQALLRLAGVPGGQVRKFEHGFRPSDAMAGLDYPAGSSEDVAAIGFSAGPVKALLAALGLRASGEGFQSPSGPAGFVEPRLLRFQTQDGRWHRLLLVGGLWGDVAREAARKMVALGYKRLLVFGIGGGLAPGARIGDIHRPCVAASLDGTVVASAASMSRWLKLPRGAAVQQARVIGTFSPLMETADVIERWRREGWTTVEMELPRFLEGVRDSGRGDVAVDGLCVISDVPGAGAGHTLESRYHNRQDVARAGERCVRWLASTLGARRIELERRRPPRRSLRVGIYTGTFDPPHRGHVGLARAAVEQLGLDILYFAPNAVPKHKPGATPYRVRCEMLWSAIQDDPRLDMLADPEARAAHAQRGAQGLIALLKERLGPTCRYVQVMGADTFVSVSRQGGDLVEATRENGLAVFLRHGTPDAAVREAASRVPGKVTVLREPSSEPISSTKIRARLRAGERVDDLLPAQAQAIARRWSLYRRPDPAERASAR